VTKAFVQLFFTAIAAQNNDRIPDLVSKVCFQPHVHIFDTFIYESIIIIVEREDTNT